MLGISSRFFAVVILSLFFTYGWAQPKNNSPYSRLGLGDFQPQNFAVLSGLSGMSPTYHDHYHLNVRNPASLAYLRATAFEVGADAKLAKLKTDSASVDAWSGSLRYISLAFPLRNPINEALEKKKHDWFFGMGFSVMPYTQVGYNIQSTSTVINDPDTETANTYQGEGGTWKLLWHNGARYKNFSFGLQLGFLYGQIQNNRTASFSNNTAIRYTDNFDSDFSVNGFIWKVGMIYDYHINKNSSGKKAKVLTFGLTANPTTSFTTKTTELNIRESGILGNEILSDVEDVKGNGKLPAEIELGVLYSSSSRWRFGASYAFTGWDKYENDAKEETLNNTFEVGLGMEYTPDATSYNRYFKRVRYRVGSFYKKDPRSIEGEQFKNYGLNLGLGLPIIRKNEISFMDVAFEIGRQAPSQDIEETYYRLTIGFTLNNNSWFFKRKFN